MRTEMGVEVDRPVAEVFDYTTNNVAAWGARRTRTAQPPSRAYTRKRCPALSA